jgi:hypothetical protein
MTVDLLMTPFQGQRSRSYYGQSKVSTKPLLFELLSDQLQTWCESNIWSVTELINFWDRSASIFMGPAAGRELLTPRSNFEIDGTIPYHIMLHFI